MTQPLEKAASRRFFFRKENRVLKRADFKKVYNEARPVRRSLIHVFILPPNGGGDGDNSEPSAAPPPPTRLGITATKKAGNAVHRNRARRLVRESFRHLLPDLKPGYTIIVNTMRSATTASMAKVDAQLRDVLRQAGVFAEATPNKTSEKTPLPSPTIPTSPTRPTPPPTPNLFNRFFIGLIRVYQLLIAPLFPPACRYYPSCSRYAVDALRRRSLPVALGKIVWRLLRCNPFTRGGYDPVDPD